MLYLITLTAQGALKGQGTKKKRTVVFIQPFQHTYEKRLKVINTELKIVLRDQ